MTVFGSRLKWFVYSTFLWLLSTQVDPGRSTFLLGDHFIGSFKLFLFFSFFMLIILVSFYSGWTAWTLRTRSSSGRASSASRLAVWKAGPTYIVWVRRPMASHGLKVERRGKSFEVYCWFVKKQHAAQAKCYTSRRVADISHVFLLGNTDWCVCVCVGGWDGFDFRSGTSSKMAGGHKSPLLSR